jgi:hypothetical protein
MRLSAERPDEQGVVPQVSMRDSIREHAVIVDVL